MDVPRPALASERQAGDPDQAAARISGHLANAAQAAMRVQPPEIGDGSGSPMSATEPHFFDRLAMRHTRRHALKTAAATGAALTFPFLRASPARADDPTACRKGCLRVFHDQAPSFSATCTLKAEVAAFFWLGYGPALGLGFFSAPVAGYKSGVRLNKCTDRVMAQWKAATTTASSQVAPGSIRT